MPGAPAIMAAMSTNLYFVYPGDLDAATGGYHYDRRLISELLDMGLQVHPVALPQCSLAMENNSRQQVRERLAAIPDQAVVIVDGLALGVLDEEAQAEAKRLRLIALCHHPLALESGLDEAQQRALFDSEKRALESVRVTLVTSDNTRRILVDDYSVPDDCITVAVPGVDKQTFAACTGDPPRLLTVATLTQRKVHDVLIDALAGLVELGWQARFVGGDHFDPDWVQQLRQRAANAGLRERIEFAGSVPDIFPEYLEADVFVLPSRFEGYGMVFAEALAAGLPIIAARAGAVPDLVPEKASLLVPPDDASALGDAIRRLLTQEGLRQQLQDGAREVASTLPNWQDSAKKVFELVMGVNQS